MADKQIINEPPNGVGVIVGRFQVPFLHQAHKELLDSIQERHRRIVVFLGVSPVPSTRRDPLEFDSRRQMILSYMPQAIVLPISDRKHNDEWVRELDSRIRELFPFHSVTVYGGRDSFLDIYLKNGGKYPAMQMHQSVYISGTQLRQDSFDMVKNSPEFRHGVIFATQYKYSILHSTVDVVPVRKGHFLVAKKPNEKKYRFVGGFTDPSSVSDEHDAARELFEETGLVCQVQNLEYLGSRIIYDWRYVGSGETIRTRFFIAHNPEGTANANDDIEHTEWLFLKPNNFDKSNFELEHHELLDIFEHYCREKGLFA